MAIVHIAIFDALNAIVGGHDGTKDLGVPPRLYNQAARVIAKQEHNSVAENARLFALLNIAQADAGIASCCRSQSELRRWRPDSCRSNRQ